MSGYPEHGFKVIWVRRHRELSDMLIGIRIRNWKVKVWDFELRRYDTFYGYTGEFPTLDELRKTVKENREYFRKKWSQKSREAEAIAALVGKTFEME
jgi:hypothetical protein